ncbi:MAG: sigma-70 family RNA polymerase sigma factor [Candidatus Eremiobacteraeota bacterium]|nr:sigma-70 family RNA polymerase sigma factor [Candidatus Eremiobacteraeota bacterium]
MASTPARDEDLAIAFAAHERSAFGEAYRRHAALLYSAAYNVLGNVEEAQDSVADAIAKLWRSPHAYSPARGNLRSFLVVCVRNNAISRRRRQARRMRSEERLAAISPDREEFAVDDPIDRDRVRRAMGALPAEQRVALELAYYGGKTHTEIATELQEPLGTIKSRIKLGLRKLASALEDVRGGDRP